MGDYGREIHYGFSEQYEDIVNCLSITLAQFIDENKEDVKRFMETYEAAKFFIDNKQAFCEMVEHRYLCAEEKEQSVLNHISENSIVATPYL